MRAASVATLLLLPASVVAAGFERPIRSEATGWVRLPLDAHVYEMARLDLGDLRVVDESQRSVPYFLERSRRRSRDRLVQPAILNRGFVRGKSASISLDLGVRTMKHRLELELSGDNFRRRVHVEGSEDGEQWLSLRDDAYVFAVPGADPLRFETVQLPPGDHRFLRVTVFHGDEDPGRIAIEAARVGVASPHDPGMSSETRVLRPNRAEDAERGETLLVLDLGARRQPFLGFGLEVEDERFFRRVVVEARRDPPPPTGSSSLLWIELDRGVVHRYEVAGGFHERVNIDVRGRARVVRLRIRNGDDAPLKIARVRVVSPVEQLVFRAEAGRHYRLSYGSKDLTAPSYDLQRTLAAEDRSTAALARFGRPVTSGQEPPAPWSERHPRLFLGLLVLVVAVLLGITLAAVKKADPAR